MLNWLYVDMNSFFASCEQADRPELVNKPIAVVPFIADTTCCLAASYEAKRLGIKTGTLLREAKKLCPQIIFIKASHHKYLDYHEKIKEAVESCAPIEKVCSVDEFAIKLTGSQQKKEVAEKLAEKIKQVIAQKVSPALTCSIGISVNRLLAKVAADMKKPNGLTVIEKHELPEKLYQLKLSDLPGVGRKTEQHLFKNNIRTVEQLMQKSKKEFGSTWGSVWGDRLYLMLRGDDLNYDFKSGSSIGHQHVLEPKLRTYMGGYKTALKLLNKAAIRLRDSEQYTKKLSLSVYSFQTKASYDHSISFSETQDTITLIKHLKSLWMKLPKHMEPARVSVTFTNFTPVSSHQFSFFDQVKLEKAFKAIDSINKKHGKNTVFVGAVSDNNNDTSAASQIHISFSHVPKKDN